MHKSSMLRMEWFIDKYIKEIYKENIKVLDVGSYNVNGSYKNLFSDKKYTYTGLDMEKGPNVDIVLDNPYDWSHIKTDEYDVVISGQAFEHMEFFWLVVVEMVRVLKKGGLLCIIAPNGFPEHRVAVDCYRFFFDGMAALARYTSLEILHIDTNAAPSRNNLLWYKILKEDSMLVARKNYARITKIVNLKKYKCVPLNHAEFRNGMIPFVKLSYHRRLLVLFISMYQTGKVIIWHIREKVFPRR